jgi:hypothetical protein
MHGCRCWCRRTIRCASRGNKHHRAAHVALQRRLSGNLRALATCSSSDDKSLQKLGASGRLLCVDLVIGGMWGIAAKIVAN